MKIPDRILKKVQKPSRYVGKEFNIVKKDLEGIRVRFAFCFPDVYDVGMSHLGLRILYHTMNKGKIHIAKELLLHGQIWSKR